MHRTGRTVKDKNNTLSSEDLREILRSDESEDELVEFIKNSFPKKGPAIGNNNKTRSRTSAKPKDEELMHEIDLDAAASITSQPNSTRANVYDLSANGESIILGCRKRSARLRTCLAIGLYISFFALGSSVAILGPSLLDLKDQVGASSESMSSIFTVRSIGYLIGSIIAGWLFDKWNGNLFLAVACIFASVSLIITPFTSSFAMLMISIFCQGLALALLDTGGNVLILNLYGKNSEAPMQALHAMFGGGAFFSPLMVRPFLSSAHSSASHMQSINISANITLNATSHQSHSGLRYPYAITMLLFLIPIVIFMLASCRDDGHNESRQISASVENSDNRAYRGFTLVLLFIFLLLYVGLEVAIGGLIFTYAVQHQILKSKSLAAYLTSTFWGSFCLGRFVSIPLSTYVRAYRILQVDLLCAFLGACLLIIFSVHYPIWLWLGTALLGLSMSSVFPSTMTWAETFMHISSRTASILVVGASLGEMTIPFTIGTLMSRGGPQVFLRSILVIVILAIFVFIMASFLARRQKKQDINGVGFHYHKSNAEPSNHGLFSKSKGDEVIQLLEDSSEIFSIEN